MPFYHPNIHRCEHIKANGTQCGSPSLRHKKLCFFHERWQAQRLAIADSGPRTPAGMSIAPALNLPVLEDANSIQFAIMQVLQLVLTGQLEHKTASLALYALQTASSNLRHVRFDPYPRDVVINPAKVDETLMGAEIWKNSDFNAVNGHEEDEHEVEDDRDNNEEATDVEAEEETKEESEEKTDAETKEETEDYAAITQDGGPQRAADENDALEQDAVPALPPQSAPRSLQKMSDAPPPNWREEIRSQIAARVLHAAFKGSWINEMLRSSKSARK